MENLDILLEHIDELEKKIETINFRFELILKDFKNRIESLEESMANKAERELLLGDDYVIGVEDEDEDVGNF